MPSVIDNDRRRLRSGPMICFTVVLLMTGCGEQQSADQKYEGPGHYGYRAQRPVTTSATTTVAGTGMTPAIDASNAEHARRTDIPVKPPSSRTDTTAKQARPRAPVPARPPASRPRPNRTATSVPATTGGGTRPAPPPLPREKVFAPAPPVPPLRTPEELAGQHAKIAEMSREPHTAEAACEKSVESAERILWGPRAPRSSAALIDRRVVVNYEFDDVNTSAACRPHYVQAVVLAHDKDRRHVQSSETVVVDGLRGSVAIALPEREAGPPYFVRIRALGFDRLPSPETKIRLDR